MSRPPPLAILAIALTLVVACADDGGPRARAPTSFDLTAVPAELAVGDSLHLRPLVRVLDAGGDELAGIAVRWASLDTLVADFDNGDQLVAHDSGVVRVRAMVDVPDGFIAGNRSIHVRITVRELSLAAARDSLSPGDQLALVLVARDGRGRDVPASRVALSSSDTTVLRANAPAGEVIALSDGDASVTATADGVTATLPLRVRLATLPLGGAALARLAIAASYACGVRDTQAATCWGGLNEYGQLGTGTAGDAPSGVQVVTGGLQLARIDANQATTCGVSADGRAWCWGELAHGASPLGNASPSEAPLAGATLPIASVAVGPSGAICAIDAEGASACWGSNTSWLLGREPAEPKLMEPLPVSGGHAWRAIDAGYDHACGVTTAGALRCWGILSRVVPDGPNTPTPQLVASTATFTSVVSGQDFSCALDVAGVAHCLGINGSGQLGRGTTQASGAQPLAPVSGAERFTALFAGDRYACGLTAAGDAWCWGARARGILPSSVPVRFSRLERFVAFAAGARGACGLTATGAARCAPVVIVPRP